MLGDTWELIAARNDSFIQIIVSHQPIVERLEGSEQLIPIENRETTCGLSVKDQTSIEKNRITAVGGVASTQTIDTHAL